MRMIYMVLVAVLVLSIANVRTSVQPVRSDDPKPNTGGDALSPLLLSSGSDTVHNISSTNKVSGLNEKVLESTLTSDLAQTNNGVTLSDFPYTVQAWPDNGDVKPATEIPRVSNRTLFLTEDLEELESFLQSQPLLRMSVDANSSTATINPFLPSYKLFENKFTHLNLEIPIDFSIQAPMTSKIPWSNVTSAAFYEGRIRSGFRNQMMVFTMLILETISEGHHQFLVRSASQKDTYGTNSFIPFEKLWDIQHWNSHYPALPRLVDYDPILHSQFNFDNTRWFRTANGWFGTPGLFVTKKPTRPYGFGYQHKLMSAYMRYAKGKGPYAARGGHRHPAEKLMLEGALRPHPDLQAIVDRLKNEMLGRSSSTAAGSNSNNNGNAVPPDPYMTLHARVEPDMQKHKVCVDKKVLNLTDIFDFLERQWPDPPVQTVFIPINRQFLEREGKDPALRNNTATNADGTPKKNKINWIAVNNLKALNHARDYGLWGGRVKVFEFGANALANTTYAKKPSTAGAMLNFFLSVSASIFVGTEVSSFSLDLVATRFFQGNLENYKYLPDGLHKWTSPGTVDPPGFHC